MSTTATKGRFQNSGFKGNSQSSASVSSSDKEKKPTTHYMIVAKDKGEPMEFVPGVFVRETPFGFSISIMEGVPAGNYFVNKKKDKQ